MMEFVKLYVTAAVTFLVLDGVWLGVIAPKFYKKHIGAIMADKANFLAAGLFYILFIAGLVYFVIQPAVREQSALVALQRGAFFGLVTYGTFDLTSQALLKDWPWIVTGVDLLWGMFITAVVSGLSVLLYRVIFVG